MASRRSRIRLAPNVAVAKPKETAVVVPSEITQNEVKEREVILSPTDPEPPVQSTEPREKIDNVDESKAVSGLKEIEPEIPENKSDEKSSEAKKPTISPVKCRARFSKVRPNLGPVRRNSAVVIEEEPLTAPPIKRLVTPADFEPEKQQIPIVENEVVVQPVVQQKSTSTSELKKPTNSTISSKSTTTSGGDGTARVSFKKTARRHFNGAGQEPPERNKMTMFDLIYWNPATNPMEKSEPDVIVNDVEEEIINEEENNEENVTEENDVASEVDEMEDAMPVPRVKLAADGTIILDEKSLVIETTASKKGLDKTPVVYEKGTVTYSSFRPNRNGKFWDGEETKKFYKVLNSVGTDFSMMTKFFPNRSRNELKLKFNREDRVNKELVDKAINEPQQFDFSHLEEYLEPEDSNVDQPKAKKTRPRGKTNRRRGAKRGRGQSSSATRGRKRKCVYVSGDSDSDTQLSATSGNGDGTEPPILSFDDPNGNEESCVQVDEDLRSIDSDNEERVVWSLLRPTRSGRQPKKASTLMATAIEPPRRRVRRMAKPSVSPIPTNDQLETVLGRTSAILTTPVPTKESLVFVPASNTQVIHIYRISPLTQAFNMVPSKTFSDSTAPMVPGQQIILSPVDQRCIQPTLSPLVGDLQSTTTTLSSMN